MKTRHICKSCGSNLVYKPNQYVCMYVCPNQNCVKEKDHLGGNNDI